MAMPGLPGHDSGAENEDDKEVGARDEQEGAMAGDASGHPSERESRDERAKETSQFRSRVSSESAENLEEEEQRLSEYSRRRPKSKVSRSRPFSRPRKGMLLGRILPKSATLSLGIFLISLVSVRILLCLKEAATLNRRAGRGGMRLPVGGSTRGTGSSSPAVSSRRLAERYGKPADSQPFDPDEPPPPYSSLPDLLAEPAGPDVSEIDPPPPYSEHEALGSPPAYALYCPTYFGNPVPEYDADELSQLSDERNADIGRTRTRSLVLDFLETTALVLGVVVSGWFIRRALGMHRAVARDRQKIVFWYSGNGSANSSVASEILTGSPSATSEDPLEVLLNVSAALGASMGSSQSDTSPAAAATSETFPNNLSSVTESGLQNSQSEVFPASEATSKILQSNVSTSLEATSRILQSILSAAPGATLQAIQTSRSAPSLMASDSSDDVYVLAAAAASTATVLLFLTAVWRRCRRSYSGCDSP